MTLDEIKEKYPVGVRVILANNSTAEVIEHEWFPPINGVHFAGIIVIDSHGFKRMFNPDIKPRMKISAI